MTLKKPSGENKLIKAIIICGPTGSGKSDLAMHLARRLGGRIISADSRQIYRRLDIGTAKPSSAERREIPHYMIDIADVDEEFAAKRYANMATLALIETAGAGAIPIVVGGAGLYLLALTGGLFEGPGGNAELRKELALRAEVHGSEDLYRELARVDAKAARKLSPSDEVRIIRALEVFLITGRRISDLQSSGNYHRPPAEFLWLGLSFSRKVLYERINNRVDRMISDGLIAEVEGLNRDGYGNSLRKKRIVGYYEIIDSLGGLISMANAVNLIKQHSRNYAKRQITWFGHKSPAVWLSPQQPNFYAEVFEKVDDYLSKKA
jgi:tRNA dimethylallyltransferase